jgi:alanyl-tRNA synthetase
VAGDLAARAEDIGGVAFVGYQVPDGTAPEGIRKLALDVRGRLAGRPAVVMIAGVPSDRPVVVIAVSDQARERGAAAGDLVRTAARQLGGGGGGRDDVAQGGGAPQGDQAPAVVAEAFAAVRTVVRDMARPGGVA